jgi:hypothetical protein
MYILTYIHTLHTFSASAKIDEEATGSILFSLGFSLFPVPYATNVHTVRHFATSRMQLRFC